MKHVSFALRLSYETCFVNRKFIDFLDFCSTSQFPVLVEFPNFVGGSVLAEFPELAVLDGKRYKIILST